MLVTTQGCEGQRQAPSSSLPAGDGRQALLTHCSLPGLQGLPGTSRDTQPEMAAGAAV